MKSIFVCVASLLALCAPSSAATSPAASSSVPALPYTPPVVPPYNFAQYVNTGMLTSITLDDATDFYSGGTIGIDGVEFVIPKNTYLTLPNINVMFSEIFNDDGTPNIPNFLAPGIGYETTVYGNQVNGDIILALVFITQSTVRIMNGFINQIDQSTGEFWVGGSSAVPNSGVRCRLNDPVGRYGLPYTDWPQWSVDDENPSVTAMTGYPMCIPRTSDGSDDPLCPLKNRIQNGQIQYIIQMENPFAINDTAPDAMLTAPILVGDYVTLNGLFVPGGLFAVYELLDNVGLYTVAGTQPSYLRSERAQAGIWSSLANAEVGETRAVIYSTDVESEILFVAQEIDPCTGIPATPEPPNFGGSPEISQVQPLGFGFGQVAGQAIFRAGPGNFPNTRNQLFLQNGANNTISKNNLTTGQVVAPVWLFGAPELLTPGDEMFPIDFTNFQYLWVGSGPFEEGVFGSNFTRPEVVGPLDPWPAQSATETPSPLNCPGSVIARKERRQATSTSTSAAATPTVVMPDTVTLSVTDDRGRGQNTYVIAATSSQNVAPFPVLVLSGTGVATNLAPEELFRDPDTGIYTTGVPLQVRDTDSGFSSMTVTSSFGGTITVNSKDFLGN